MTSRGRHVLIFSVVFPPDNVSTGHLVGYLADDLTAAGHRVSVITTRPHSRPDPAARVPDVRIIRIPVPRKGTSALRNAFIWLLYLIGSFWAGMFRGKKPDVVLAVTPPPGIGLIGLWVARRYRAKLVYNVKELYPDVAVALGVLDARPLVAMMRWTENRAFRKAEVVVAATHRIAERVRTRSGDTPVEVIPDGVDLAAIVPGVDGTEFRREFAINAPLVIGYAGNMGMPQNLDLLLDASRLVAGVGIVLVGDGTERERLAQRVRVESLDNVTLVPHQPATRMSEIYAACDVMFVPLAPGLSADAMPSKAYQALAAERPIISAAPLDSPVNTLVMESHAGFTVDPLTPEGIAAVIRSIDRKDLAEMGKRGRDFVRAHYSREAASADYLRIVDGI